jgi:hypothetical protein
MRPEWCSPIEEPDLVTFAAEVERVAAAWSAGSGELRAAARAGRDFVVQHYSRDGLRDDLRSVFAALSAEGSGARQSGPVTVRHYSVARRGLRPRLRPRLRRVLTAARGR